MRTPNVCHCMSVESVPPGVSRSAKMITKYLPHGSTYQLPMSAEYYDIFPMQNYYSSETLWNKYKYALTTKASLDVCQYIPRGVQHPIRSTSVPRPLQHLILVDFAGNLVHLRSFVSESIF